MAFLESLRDLPLSHFERSRRHPIDIFATASRDLFGNLDDLLDLVEVGKNEQLYLPGKKPNDWAKNVIRQLDHTADSIVQYFDSCRAIIICCYKCEDKGSSTKAVRRFNKAVSGHTDRVTAIVNLIKHNQRTLNLVYFHDPGVFIPGYYVEGVLEPDIAGPDPKIHPGSNTAISFYREIPAFVCAFYFSAAVMAAEVHAATKVGPSKDYAPSEQIQKLVLSALKKTSLLPPTFFPDEIKLPVPLVRYSVKPGRPAPLVDIEMPTKRVKARTPERARVSTSWTVSSVARTLEVPYMGMDHLAADA